MSETPHSHPGTSPRPDNSSGTKQTQPIPPRNPHAQDSLRDVGLVAAILVGIVMVIAGVWMYQAREDGKDPRKGAAVANGKPATSPAGRRPVTPSPVLPVSAGPVPAKAAPAARAAATTFDVQFDLGGSALSAKAKRVLDREAGRMKKEEGLTVLIHGHTDSRGSRAANHALGQKRALAVQEYLVEAGIPKTSIQVFSLGETGPLCRVDREPCHRKNRRVHVEWKVGSDTRPASVGRAAPVSAEPDSVRSTAETDGPRAEGDVQPPRAETPAKS